MFSYFEPNFIEKFLWESVFSNFGQNRNDAKIKIGYLAAILKRYTILIFSGIFVFDSAYIMVPISLQNSDGKVVFLGTNGSKSTLVT